MNKPTDESTQSSRLPAGGSRVTGAEILAREIAAALAPLLKDQVVPKRLYTTAEAAEYLGMSPEGVRKLVANNELRAVKLDTSLRFDVKDLALLVETHKG